MVSTSGNIHTPQNRNDLETLMKNPSEISKKTIDNIKAGIEQGSRVLSINKIVNRIAEQKFKEMNSEKLTEESNNLKTFIGAKMTYYDAKSKNGIIKFGRGIANIFSTNFGAIHKGTKLRALCLCEIKRKEEIEEILNLEKQIINEKTNTVTLKSNKIMSTYSWKQVLVKLAVFGQERYVFVKEKKQITTINEEEKQITTIDEEEKQITTIDFKGISWNADMCDKLMNVLIASLREGQTVNIDIDKTQFTRLQLDKITEKVANKVNITSSKLKYAFGDNQPSNVTLDGLEYPQYPNFLDNKENGELGEGFQQIASSLKENTTLKSLTIKGTPLKNDAFMKSIIKNVSTTIQKLEIDEKVEIRDVDAFLRKMGTSRNKELTNLCEIVISGTLYLPKDKTFTEATTEEIKEKTKTKDRKVKSLITELSDPKIESPALGEMTDNDTLSIRKKLLKELGEFKDTITILDLSNVSWSKSTCDDLIDTLIENLENGQEVSINLDKMLLSSDQLDKLAKKAIVIKS